MDGHRARMASIPLRACPVALLVAAFLAACSGPVAPDAPRDAQVLAPAAGSTLSLAALEARRATGSGAVPSDRTGDAPGPGPAALPDRGALVAERDPSREAVALPGQGAYRWRAVDVSEEHAIAAAVPGGEMQLRTPDGQALTLEYVRHVEHPGGDWSWIGRVRGLPADVEEALITFGADAVFGQVPHPDAAKAPLRLTTQAGTAWLGQASYDALARSPLSVTPGDALTVPEDVPVQGESPAAMATMAAEAAAEIPAVERALRVAREASAMALPTHTVDLLVGYTPGFLQAMGSRSAVVTRLNYVTDEMNLVLRRSGISGRVRLLDAQYVEYEPGAVAGTTRIDVALRELSPGWTEQPVPASLQSLIAARETLGADLVSIMVGPGNNAGCGVAWLLKHFDAAYMQRWGYSAHAYGCEHALKHELGHNMGLAHDRETVGEVNEDPGIFPYAYGYRTRQPDGIGFITTMGYQFDAGTPNAMVYSTPRRTYKGLPTGTDNDYNTRALLTTFPLASQASPTRVVDGLRPRQDVNGDGNSDIIVRNAGSRKVGHWRMRGHTVASAPASQSYASQLTLAATGDFDGDGRTDILWRRADHTFRLWTASGSGWSASTIDHGPIQAASGVVGAADIDGDGRDEVLIINNTSRFLTYWKVAGTRRTGHRQYAINPANQLVAAGDLNGDGRQDLVWMNSARQLNLWWSNGNGFGEARSLLSSEPVPNGWTVAGVADITGDGQGDLVFFNHSNARFMWWEVRAGQVHRRNAPRQLNTGTQLVALGDYNGDGIADALMRTSNDVLKVWYSDGVRIPSSSVSVTRRPASGTVVVKGGIGG